VSNYCCLGYDTSNLARLPKDIGVEVFIEYGNDYYWEHMLPPILAGRKGPLSVHAPFVNMNLADPEQDFGAAFDTYLWAFGLCEKYGAKHCVCHPHSAMIDDRARLDEARKLCVERVVKLSRKAEEMGIELLIENMPQRECIMDEKNYLGYFAPVKELNFLIDTGHARLGGWDMPYVMSVLGSRIKGYHLNDNMGDADSHLMVNKGSIDWEKFFAAYVRYTPDASAVCEYQHGTMEEIEDSIASIKAQIACANEIYAKEKGKKQ
jgi:sugar phosphate isomerase/epimerase